MSYKIRYRPYLDMDDVIVLERIKEATGISHGAILQKLLYESETFLKIKEIYKDCDKETIKKAYLGLIK
ncbi:MULTISPECIES: hypothetical protein [unclassified Lebetimonas]|uniref:hypothetical protein n=1 Tax=unclassified Lebetimonas TaxID=2648158 RepID=UPI0004633901|nr:MULTISPECIES: hypothetical protein [unclassified Lebetimonas]